MRLHTLFIILLLTLIIVGAPYAVLAEVNTLDYLTYTTEGGTPYYTFYYWPTNYYTSYYSQSKVPVTISVEGFPSQYTTSLKVDDASAGVIPGGGTVYVEINWKVGHTFSVQSYVEGAKGERFHCSTSSWYLEKFNRPTREAKAANTFYYTPEYSLTISTSHGDTTASGWYAKGSQATLSTLKSVEISQGEREVFDGWSISGSSTKDSTTTVILNSALDAKAQYHTEYYLQIKSEHGNPSGTGWYRTGYTAPIEVEKELPLEGLMGSLSGKRIFNGWSGGASSGNNIADVVVDSPKTVTARWREDYSTPYLILTIIIIIIIAMLVLLSRKGAIVMLPRKGVIRIKEKTPQPEQATSTLDILERRYAQGEITREEFVKIRKDLQRT